MITKVHPFGCGIFSFLPKTSRPAKRRSKHEDDPANENIELFDTGDDAEDPGEDLLIISPRSSG